MSRRAGKFMLAGSLDGRPARDAMLPAMLADSTIVTPQLLAMSQNATWLLAVATSSTEPAARRRRVVSLLSRFDDPRVKEALKGLVER